MSNNEVDEKSSDLNDTGIEAEIVDADIAVAGSETQSEEVVIDKSPQGILIKVESNNHNKQSQIISQDFTTVANIFRVQKTEDSGFFKKLVIELLLSILEPDRFLKNAKAIFTILIGIALYCFIRSLTFDQALKLIEAWSKVSK